MKAPRPSAALVVALLALVVALSGTAYAVAKSNGDDIIKKNSLSGNRLKANTLKGTKIDESTLATVPRANAVPAPAFHDLVPATGWAETTDYSARPLGWYKDASGFVHLQGAVTFVGGPGGSANLTALPGPARPTTKVYETIVCGISLGQGTIRVSEIGDVTHYTGDDDLVLLDGVSFYAG